MKTKKIIIIVITLVASISAIIFLISILNHAPNTSFYYGGVRLSENDKLCFVTLTINNATITPAELVKNIKIEISKLGPNYDFAERKISAEQISQETISVEIGGSWRTTDSNDRPNLLKLVSNIGGGTVADRLLMTCA